MHRIISALFLLYSLTAFSQESEDLRFANYLIDREEYKDCLFVLSEADQDKMRPDQIDSLNFLKATAHFQLKDLEQAYQGFAKIEGGSPFFDQAGFYRAYCLIFLDRYEDCWTELAQFKPSEEREQLRYLYLGGIALLQRDYVRYDSISTFFSFTDFQLSEEQKNFATYKADLQAVKHKSPFLAALYSAFIPGLGKVYAGHGMKGLSTFLQTTTIGVVAAESLLRGGLLSPQFIVFGGIFAVIYTGNIWGSVFSVQIKRNENYRKIDNDLKLDLHLPLHRVFGK